MDTALFLQCLRDLPLEEGRAYMREHIEELCDHKTIGELLAEEALRILYTPFLSLKLAELLIFYGEYTGHLSSHALGLKAKGDVLFQIGHHKAAMECLDAAGDEFRLLEDEGNWARSRISWILSAGWLGYVEEALQQAKQSRNVFLRLGEYYWVGVIDNNTAMVCEYVGRYQDALKLYENMLKIFSSVSDQSENAIKRSIAITQVNYARNLSWLGKLERAYSLLEEAQASFVSLGEMVLSISVEIDLADLDYTQGYYGSALRRYYQARDNLIENNIDNPVLLAELKLCMANCLVKLNRVQEACLLSEEAVKIYRQSGMSLGTVNALREHAMTLAASNKFKEALLALDETWILFNQGGFEPYAYATRLQQAELLLEMGAVDTAYEQAYFVKNYCDAQSLIARSIRSSLIMVSALIENAQRAGVRHEKDGQTKFLQEAMLLCKQVTLQARQHNLQEEIYKCHYLLGRIFSLQENLSKGAKHYAAAIAQVERILDDLIFDLSPSFLNTAWSVYEDMIALCLQQSQVERAFCYLEQARSMALRQHLSRSKASQNKKEQKGEIVPTLLRTQSELKEWQALHRHYSVLLAEIDTSVSPTLDRNIIKAELSRCEVKLNELFERLYLHELSTYPGPRLKKAVISEQAAFKTQLTGIDQVRKHLTSNHLLLEYYLHKDKLVIFAITAEHLMLHENPDGVAQLEYLLPLLHAHLQPSGWPNPSQPPQAVIHRLLNKLYNLLISPVASLLPSASGYLTIVPYGPLHKLPFHALFADSRFLIEDYQINYLPTSTLMSLSNHGGEQEVSSTARENHANSSLVFGYSQNGQLQRVQDEAKTIASLLNGDCYLEKAATIARLIQQAPHSPIIHLATHGQNRLDAPNFSYVCLADGQLNAIDAFNLDLEGCELVTLSGCETGLSLSGGGDEQLGLGRAFLAAGANSLLMSLWSVEDKATSELMKHFYQHLLNGESKVQALRAAQCHFARQEGFMFSHPYFWAAFRLVGDIQPLRYRRS